jgi:hypothetical protein
LFFLFFLGFFLLHFFLLGGVGSGCSCFFFLFFMLSTAASNVPQLDGAGRLPAVDGSQLINIGSSAQPIVAGEALAIRDLVYQDVYNQRGGGAERWYKVDSDATGPVRIGSRLYDNSLKSKLQRLQFAMKGAA